MRRATFVTNRAQHVFGLILFCPATFVARRAWAKLEGVVEFGVWDAHAYDAYHVVLDTFKQRFFRHVLVIHE